MEPLCYTCCSTDFSECTLKGHNEYKTFDRLKHEFKCKLSYVLVQTKNLPHNVPDVYIEASFTRSVKDDEDDDDSQQHGARVGEEDHGLAVSDEERDDSSEEREEERGLQHLKIRVYNHTVEFHNNWTLVVSIKGMFTIHYVASI